MIRRLDHSGITGALAAERLGAPAVLGIVMAAAAPLTVAAGTITTAFAVTGTLGLPVAFVAVGVLLAVFAVGYVAMSRHLPHTGALYAYVSHGLGRAWGVAAAWMSVLAYNAIEVCLYGAIGAAISPLISPATRQVSGGDLPWWVVAVAAWALVAVLGVLRVDLNGRVLSGLLIGEVALILVYDLVLLSHPAADPTGQGGGFAWSVWSPAQLTGPGIGAALAIAVLGFVGFESAVTYAEESRQPRRTVPAATYAALAVIAVVYGVSAWAMTVAAGQTQIVPAARAQGTDLLFTLAAAHVPGPLVTAGHVLFATSITAAMISFHSTTARYVFALGREGVLPAVFGRTSPTGAPKAGSLAQTGIGLAVIVAFAVAGADPVTTLFYVGSVTGAVGILLLLALTALAVLGFFGADPRGEGRWTTTVAPAIAVLGMAVVVTIVLLNLPTLLGVPDTSPLRWGILAGYAVVAVLGVGYGLLVRATRPGVYAAIGTGAKAALVTPGSRNLGTLYPKIPTMDDDSGHRPDAGTTEPAGLWPNGGR